MVFVATVGCGISPRRRSIPILLYHRISIDRYGADTESIPLDTFAKQMRYLHEHGYSTLSLEEVERFVRHEGARRRAVCITFDDGWRSQLLAVPILREHDFKAAFLVFPERGIEDPYGDYLRWADVLELAHDARFEFGAHSMTHPWDRRDNLVTWIGGGVAGRGLRDVRHEVEDPKRILEGRLGRPVTVFAWPMGWYNDALLAVAREAGYRATLTTEPGAVHPGDDPFRLKRFYVDGSCTVEQFAELLDTERYPTCASGQKPWLASAP